MENHYIKKIKGKQGTAYYYEITSHEEFKLLREQVAGVLDDNVDKLKEAKQPASRSKSEGWSSSPQPVQKPNEPVKQKKTKELVA